MQCLRLKEEKSQSVPCYAVFSCPLPHLALSIRTSRFPGASCSQPGSHEEQERGEFGSHSSGNEALPVPPELLRAGNHSRCIHPCCCSGPGAFLFLSYPKVRAAPHQDIRSQPRGSGSFQEAPVVARASLFLECARFVHRCNRGNWPEWMKGHHVNITKRGLSRGRSPIVGNKRNQKLQWNAAKHFCQWGDVSGSPISVARVVASCENRPVIWRLPPQAIGTRLSELCHSDSESPANILGYIFDEETKRRMRKEDEEEDYLDDSKTSSSRDFPA